MSCGQTVITLEFSLWNIYRLKDWLRVKGWEWQAAAGWIGAQLQFSQFTYALCHHHHRTSRCGVILIKNAMFTWQTKSYKSGGSRAYITAKRGRCILTSKVLIFESTRIFQSSHILRRVACMLIPPYFWSKMLAINILTLEFQLEDMFQLIGTPQSTEHVMVQLKHIPHYFLKCVVKYKSWVRFVVWHNPNIEHVSKISFCRKHTPPIKEHASRKWVSMTWNFN